MNILGHFDLSVTESGDVNENSRSDYFMQGGVIECFAM